MFNCGRTIKQRRGRFSEVTADLEIKVVCKEAELEKAQENALNPLGR